MTEDEEKNKSVAPQMIAGAIIAIAIAGCGKSEDVEDLETQIYHLEDKIVELEDLAHKNIIRIEYLEDEVNDMSRDFKKLERKVDYIRYGN